MRYKIYNEDAYKIIKKFKTEKLKINHIITDPPYLISKDNNFYTMKNNRRGIDFGEWDKTFDLFSWIKLYSEILDKNGSMIIFCSYRYISYLINVLETNGLIAKDIIEWKKTNPMPRNITRRYVQDTEFAIWAVKKGAKWIFNKPENIPYLRSTFTTSTVLGKERTKHPTQKSLILLKQIIKIHTDENDVILDPFMGSGTTGIAALELRRKFYGIEIDKEYCKIAEKRFQDVLTTLI